MLRDDLRAQLTEALLTAPAGFVRADPDAARFHAEHLRGDMAVSRHDHHQYFGTCALCRGEADTLADAVLAVVQSEVDRLTAERDAARAQLADAADALCAVGRAIIAVEGPTGRAYNLGRKIRRDLKTTTAEEDATDA